MKKNVKNDVSVEKELWVEESVALLASGRGHSGIINMLRLKGMDLEMAQRVSGELFDVAKPRLVKKQRPMLILGWLFILIGILMPIVMFFSGIGYYIVSFAPCALGLTMLSKVHNPERLPVGD